MSAAPDNSNPTPPDGSVVGFSTLNHLPPLQCSASTVPTSGRIDPQFALWGRPEWNSVPILHPIRQHVSRRRHEVRTSVRVAEASNDDSTGTAAGLPRLLLGDELANWSDQANVIWIDQRQRVFDPRGRLLFAAEPGGENQDAENHASACIGPDPQAVLPFPLDARRRKSATAVRLRNRMIDPPEGLLPIRGESEIRSPEPSHVARRALALFLVATRAESVLSGQPLDADRMRSRCPIGYEAMTVQERTFFELPANDPSIVTIADQFVWRYEALMAVQWALDMQFELAWPDERADLTSVTRLMIDLPDESIVEQARLRSTTELLDATELHYQMLHALADAQAAGRDLSNLLDAGIVCERLISLAWITGQSFAPALENAQTTKSSDPSSHPDPLNITNWDAIVSWIENGALNP